MTLTVLARDVRPWTETWLPIIGTLAGVIVAGLLSTAGAVLLDERRRSVARSEAKALVASDLANGAGELFAKAFRLFFRPEPDGPDDGFAELLADLVLQRARVVNLSLTFTDDKKLLKQIRDYADRCVNVGTDFAGDVEGDSDHASYGLLRDLEALSEAILAVRDISPPRASRGFLTRRTGPPHRAESQ